MTAKRTSADGRDDEHAPLAELRRLREAARAIARAEAEQVRRARSAGYSWLEISGALGVTRQAAHKKYGRT